MNIQINNTGNDPIYLQIKNQIKTAILQGDMPPGEQLPSIRFLAKELRVSMITAKRAFDELEAEGFIHSVQGKGNFVAPQNPDLIKELYLSRIEAELQRIMDMSELVGISDAEVMEIWKSLKEINHE